MCGAAPPSVTQEGLEHARVEVDLVGLALDAGDVPAEYPEPLSAEPRDAVVRVARVVHHHWPQAVDVPSVAPVGLDAPEVADSLDVLLVPSGQVLERRVRAAKGIVFV